MTSTNANTALDQLFWIFGIEFFVCLTLGLVYVQVDKARERRELRARLAALPKPAPMVIDLDAERLARATQFPEQRAGGSR